MNLIKRLAYRRGLTIARQISEADQQAFFTKICPVETEHPLVRIGGTGDGGYLIPDDLAGLRACFSPGVDVTATFEEDMIARGIPCFQADASVERSPLSGPLIDFQRKFLGTSTDADTLTLNDWVHEKSPGGDGDLILQMDIEGAEWLVLANADDEILSRFRILAIEFHGMERIFDPFGFSIISGVFDKLLRQFDIVHAHPNNSLPVIATATHAIPCVMEYSFLRKDRIQSRRPATRFPHPLDCDCTGLFPSYPLPASMYA